MRREYSADFETTTDPNDVRVWSWGAAPNDDWRAITLGLDIESFMLFCEESDKIVYFHNLKFDGHFILDYLLRKNYKYTDERNLRAGELSTLISNHGQFFTIKYRSKETKKLVEFRDSLKKMPNFSVDKIAKTFNHEQLKGTIDYHKTRPVGYMPTHEEWQYQKNDVQIIANALTQLRDEGMTKLTVAASALAEYRRTLPDGLFDLYYPELDIDVDSDIRRAYKGGYTYGPKRYVGKITGPGVVLDVNSLYPFVMYTKLLPYGLPVFDDGIPELDEDYPLAIFSLLITAKLKPNRLPIIQIKAGTMFNSVDYLEEINEPTEITVTNIDWELYQKHYDIEIHEYLGGWKFHGNYDMFKGYIDKWSKIKQESTGGKREIAKLYLNSLYGKFGSNPRVIGKYPVLEDNIVKLKNTPEIQKRPIYTAMAVFITAYARQHIITAAQDNIDSFAYCDTDSLHLLREDIPESLEIHPTKLGAYKHEYSFTRALFMGPKKYFEDEADGTKHRHIAGVPMKLLEKYELEDMNNEMIIPGKLRPVQVPGGTVLEETVYTLKFM